MSGRFIAVVGPSGVGKDSVLTALAARAPQLSLVRRVITRPETAGGEDFEGVSEPEFLRRRDAGAFALCWQAHGLHYGIPVSVDAALAGGRDQLANLSRGVLQRAEARFSQVTIIALSASREVLARRLALRGRECVDEISRRLERSTAVLPGGLDVHRIDNSGPLTDTVVSVLSLLYPDQIHVSAK
ncbi:phosphonate metabolism protein/1,5-bisphosphokinase (PRPP-forming) PhnN [Algicella marina]|uniref:Ribose 1,5-bisphosphate phosphokinase PhnN n=1 Tax=Algicella marina TaxID=2683284 RepID=A0A6P1SYB3_9RHOB|nr:phosphonate metabolism protein/1,5-bisphosphokinase (PRPP-forming) PhnN [Algicella marina]QHQ35674.1 phosphonate metabolism protein/1,5-bisphosphokinase (PRPP-forming) PhnN [Algicella marina]